MEIHGGLLLFREIDGCVKGLEMVGEEKSLNRCAHHRFVDVHLEL